MLERLLKHGGIDEPGGVRDTELVDEGENGFVAASPDPEDLAEAILRVRAAGPELRASTAAWFARNAERLSLQRSLDRVVEVYDER